MEEKQRERAKERTRECRGVILCVWSEDASVDLGVRYGGLAHDCSWQVLEESSGCLLVFLQWVCWGRKVRPVVNIFRLGTRIQGRDDPHLCG